MLLEPAVQHVGVHAVLQGYCGNGRVRLLAGHYQFGLELARVGAVGRPIRISRKVWFFEHGVHGGLPDLTTRARAQRCM